MQPDSASSPDAIIAHAELLRAVDRLLVCADEVRTKRNALESVVNSLTEKPRKRREGCRE